MKIVCITLAGMALLAVSAGCGEPPVTTTQVTQAETPALSSTATIPRQQTEAPLPTPQVTEPPPDEEFPPVTEDDPPDEHIPNVIREEYYRYFWYVYVDTGKIETNDLARLRSMIPWDIYLPSYLPADIDPRDTTFDTVVPNQSGTPSMVTFGYASGKIAISITEYVVTGEGNPNLIYPDLATEHWTFNGIDIVEQSWQYRSPPTATEISTGFRFLWNWDNRYFQVCVNGVDQQEARTIITSFIENPGTGPEKETE